MLEAEQALAERIAKAAGKIVLELYDTNVSVDYKTPSDPVTEADKRANQYLVSEIQKAFPADRIVAEETPGIAENLAAARCWYVDPLDGTKEYIAKNGEFSVMIGLAIDGEAKMGVVYQPTLDKLYTGVVGQGAFLESAGARKKISVSEIADPAQVTLVISRSHRDASTDDLVRELGIQRELRSGSVGIKVGLIAEQIADAYVHISDKSSSWDSCAPEAILRAAGGHFCDLRGRNFDYRLTNDFQNHWGIFACNTAAHRPVFDVAQRVAQKAGLVSV